KASDAQALGKLVLYPRASKGLSRSTAVIIEYRMILHLHRQAVKRDETPRPILIVSPGSVKGLSNVGTVAHGHEALQVECKLLTAASQLERSACDRLGQSDPRLLEIEPIHVDWSQHGFPGRIVGLKLHEHLYLIGYSEISVCLVPADDVILDTVR